ncbi:MAG: hypothetical protein JO266_08345, partial [Acidobacteria bacterium]|nr:hypothetical protein [Acidobacteriota bacterium]
MRFFDPTGLGKLGCEISSRTCCLAIVSVVSCFLYQARAAETELRNEALRVRIGADGSYLLAAGNKPPIIRASVGAEVDHHWLKSAEYPKHDLAESEFDGTLGHGRQATLTFAGLSNQPDLLYTIRLYTSRPFGEIRVQVQNHTGRTFEVQSLRSVDALGTAILDLQGNPSADRVLSDSFSEDWPPLRIYDLGQAPSGLHLAVGSQMIYNQESKDSLFLGAL